MKTKTGDKRDVHQFPFVEKLRNIPSVPGSPQKREGTGTRCVGNGRKIKKPGPPWRVARAVNLPGAPGSRRTLALTWAVTDTG